MRTPEVMRLSLMAAETGHLVLATMHAGTCAEALQRLCLSFPADLQASVRAQLADCLVGVSCQQLAFLSGPSLRVPRCELLLASSGARGTIRAGNFSQLATVLQSGGEEGMWSYARYQRWIEEQRDWVQTEQAAVPSPEGDAPRSTVTNVFSAAPLAASAGARVNPSTRPAVSRRSRESDSDIIELPAEDISPGELAELARQLSERKP
jgi:twitching motility protein PilT